MDVAVAIFNIGAGLGVLAAGLGLAYLAWQASPLIRESRALAADVRRLARTTETHLEPILAHARELAGNVEVLSEDVAVKLDRATDLMNSLQRSLDTVQVTAAPRLDEPQLDHEPRAAEEPAPLWDEPPRWDVPPTGEEAWPVESSETREERSGS
jgi:hypothetical protein